MNVLVRSGNFLAIYGTEGTQYVPLEFIDGRSPDQIYKGLEAQKAETVFGHGILVGEDEWEVYPDELEAKEHYEGLYGNVTSGWSSRRFDGGGEYFS
jgi:hypothetical protein